MPIECKHDQADVKGDAESLKTILLLGNPGVGKTVLFNRLCGKRVQIANHPGTSVPLGRGVFSENGKEFAVIDAPGIDQLVPESRGGVVPRDILLREKPDTIAQVADGKNLRRALLLFLQLSEYEAPLVLDINMIDEARRRGIGVDAEKLSNLLGVPVTRTAAVEGEGVRAFGKALSGGAAVPTTRVEYPAPIESALAVINKLTGNSGLPPRALGTALLAGDEDMKRRLIEERGGGLAEQLEPAIRAAQAHFRRPLSTVILEARLKAADHVLAEVQSVSPPERQ